MLINEWEIWVTFAAYFLDPIVDLQKVAQNLVQSGLLELAFIDNGTYYWLDGPSLLTGHAEISLGANREAALINAKSPIPSGYAGHVLFDSAYFRFAELKQFARARNFPPSYIRGYLGECVLISKDNSYIVYPMIKLYDTGVILVEIRIRSPKKGITLGRFVDEYINLYKRSFDNVLIPPGLRINAQHAFFLSGKPKPSPILPILIRSLSYRFDKDLQNKISKNTTVEKGGVFNFRYVPLWDSDVIQKERNDKSKNTDPNFNVYTIRDFATDIIHAASVAIPGLRRGKSLWLKPNTPLQVGNFQEGRPHIHLLKFQGQASTARQNDAKFQNEFGWVLGGAFENNSKLGKQFLPKNAREFNDYGAYIAEYGTLWAWSKKGISNKESQKIPNNGGFIYFNQSICEMLEYGLMLHRRMYELVGSLKSSDLALKAKENLVDLETAMNQVSGYVSIRNLLLQGWEAMRINKLQTGISDLIAIRHTESSEKDARKLSALQTILSVIFGVIAIPAFASGVVKPLWNWLNLSKPYNRNAAELCYFLIALVLIEVPIYFITRSILNKNS